MISKVSVYSCRCEKCGAEWITRKAEVPKLCPKCKSGKWNEAMAESPAVEQPKPEVTGSVTKRPEAERIEGSSIKEHNSIAGDQKNR